MSDSYGERRILVAALGVAAVASLALALTSSFVVFGLATLVLGAGAGLYVPAAVTLLYRLFEKPARRSAHTSQGDLSRASSYRSSHPDEGIEDIQWTQTIEGTVIETTRMVVRAIRVDHTMETYPIGSTVNRTMALS